jgi:hypothetical protein
MMLNGKLSPFEKVLRSHILPLPGEEIAKDVLVAQIAERKICGLGKARKQVLELLISEKYVEEFEKPRSSARAEKWLRRTQKEVGKISFASHTAPTSGLVTDGLQTAPAAVYN